MAHAIPPCQPAPAHSCQQKALSRGKFSHHLAVIIPLSGRLWVLVLIQMNFYIMTKINETCSPQSLNLNMNNIDNCLLRYVNIQTVIACNSKNPYFDLNWNYESSSSKIDKTLFKLAYFLHWQASWVWHIFWASYVNFSIGGNLGPLSLHNSMLWSIELIFAAIFSNLG